MDTGNIFKIPQYLEGMDLLHPYKSHFCAFVNHICALQPLQQQNKDVKVLIFQVNLQWEDGSCRLPRCDSGPC